MTRHPADSIATMHARATRHARTVPLVVAALAFVVLSSGRAIAGDEFLGPRYPVEVEISYTAGLFQWIDSLADTSAGKTIPAHRREFVRRWGTPDHQDGALLIGFSKARLAHAFATRSRSALLGIFCEAPSVDAAVAAASKDLTPEDATRLAVAMAGLAPKFAEIWDGGSVPRAFVRRVARDGRRGELASLLARIAGFYGVDPRTMRRPRLVLVPVPDGWGTHAESIGGSLLLEIRPGDDLAAQAAVIVHENAHFLFDAMPRQRRAELADSARSLHVAGETPWRLLEEALPTAFGQGIADQTFRPSGWSRRDGWYHIPEVDAYAKALHGPVNHALAAGLPFDESFVRHAILVWAENARQGGPEILGMESRPPDAERKPTPR